MSYETEDEVREAMFELLDEMDAEHTSLMEGGVELWSDLPAKKLRDLFDVSVSIIESPYIKSDEVDEEILIARSLLGLLEDKLTNVEFEDLCDSLRWWTYQAIWR